MSTTITPTEQNIDINVTENVIDINVTNNIVDVNATAQQINIEVAGAYPIPNPVLSVFGRTGAVVATEGDYSLTQLSDVTLSSPANGQVLKYNGTIWVNSLDADTGITTLNTLTALTQTFAVGTSGTDFNISSASSTHTFNFPTASATNRGLLSSANWSNFNTAYNDSIISAAVTGTTTKTLTLNQQDGGTVTASWTDINTDAVTSVFGRTGAVVAASGDYTTTQVTEGTNLYFTDARARAAITLTTTGTSGAATYSGGTLNIPQYQGVLTNPVTGTGTTNTLPKFTAASTIGNSNIADNGSLITLGSNSFVNGLFGIGTTPVGSSSNFYITNNITGGTAWNSVYLLTNVLSDVTSQARGFVSNIGTQAATFTLSNLTHYRSEQGTFRAGSTVTTQVGYLASGSLIGATTNYAFQGSIPSGTNRWNLYMDGTAANYMAGSLGIGTTTLTNTNLNINKAITGSTTSLSVNQNGVVQSDVTTTAYGFLNASATAAAAFSLGSYFHFTADQSTIGAGSSITTQIAFNVTGSLIGATNNFGFRGAIPAGTNRWNIYMDGTANNYMAGSLGIGSTSLTGYTLRLSKSLTGSTSSFATRNEGVVLSDVTADAIGFRNDSNTQAAAFTLTNYWHFWARQGSIGAGSAITNQYGYVVDSNMIGATNNYAFQGNIPSGTNRWNLYMAGTAANYMAGNLSIGTTSLVNYVLNTQFSTSGQNGIRLRGTNASAQAQLFIENDLSTGFVIGMTGSSVASYGANSANQAVLYSTSAITLMSDNSNIKFAAGGNAERMRLDVNGNLNVGGATNNNASAKVQVDSTTQGLLPPRMTTTQKTAIGTPAAGLMVYDTTLNQMSYYNGTLWINF